MIIANGKDVGILHQILEDDFVGTVFKADKKDDFFIADFIEENMNPITAEIFTNLKMTGGESTWT